MRRHGEYLLSAQLGRIHSRDIRRALFRSRIKAAAFAWTENIQTPFGLRLLPSWPGKTRLQVTKPKIVRSVFSSRQLASIVPANGSTLRGTIHCSRDGLGLGGRIHGSNPRP